MSEPVASRRDFVRVVLAAGGALAIGVLLPACQALDPKTVAHFKSTGEFQPNAWIKITPDDHIVFVLDRVEMGQGTTTSHTTLIAEELEVNPSRITVEHAPASRDYDLPLLDLGFQITGGSSSMRTSWEPLRKAGAVAREMLKSAAAARWGVPIAELVVNDGVITHAASSNRATYGQLAASASHQPVPDPPLKPASEMKWIGKSVGRLDARTKVDGSAVYGIDVSVPGMLTAVVVRSPVLGGTPKSFRADAAKGMPGVIDVVQIPNGIAVVAKTYWEARTAAKKVEVTWDEGPLAKTSSAALWADFAERAKSPGSKVKNDGDIDAAWTGTKVVEAVYQVPYLAHATMEPQNATAHVTADRCEIWAPTQSPGLTMEEAVRITGFERSAISVHTTHVGGAFGRRSMTDFVAEAIHVSMKMNKPVKVVWSREDDFQNDFYRPMTYNLMKGAVDGSGRIVGWFHRIVAQSVAGQVTENLFHAIAPTGMPESMKAMLGRNAAGFYKSGTLADQSVLDGARDFAYAIPSLRVEHVPVELAVPCGFWRAVGHSENVYIVESFFDELAAAAKKDPLELRRTMLAASPQHLGVLDRVAKEVGWGNAPPKGIFRGIAVCKAFGTYCAQVAEVSMEKNGPRVHRVVAAIDCGTVINPDIVRSQVESAILFGLGAALRQRITLANGRVEQTNFHAYEPIRMHETPKIEVHIIKSDASPQGVGEPGLPPLAPAVANAIFAATGKPVRTMPIDVALREGGGAR
jgi:isoquinoline 1-oxidoreductase beta subunit